MFLKFCRNKIIITHRKVEGAQFMYNSAITAFNSMNYLFLQHAFLEPSLFGSDIIETELQRFLQAIGDEDGMLHPTSALAFDTIRELKEGGYLEKYTPQQFKMHIQDSIRLILGYEHKELFEFYAKCIDAVTDYHHSYLQLA
jgi:hypothetical protein